MSRPIPRLTQAWLRHRETAGEVLAAAIFLALVGTLIVLPWLFV